VAPGDRNKSVIGGLMAVIAATHSSLKSLVKLFGILDSNGLL
jgi:hypothetical protein